MKINCQYCGCDHPPTIGCGEYARQNCHEINLSIKRQELINAARQEKQDHQIAAGYCGCRLCLAVAALENEETRP